MIEMKELFQSADFKSEKHAPMIEAPEIARKGEFIRISASVGKEIAHPNTTAHHIRWIELYFQPEGEKFPYQIARAEFTAHGASTQGPDTSTMYTGPSAVVHFRTDKPGTILASSNCNIHGLWQASRKLGVE